MITQTSNKPHFSILATSFAGGPRPRNAAIILSGLWLLLFFAALFTPPLLDDADATHAEAAQAMVRSGDLVTLHVEGVRYLEKAPLPYWLVAISFRLFGFNAFAAHLPQALAVALLVLLGHRWGNHAFGARTGFYTAIALLTSAGVFLFTRILIPEVLLSLFLAAALYAFLKTLTPEPAYPDQPNVPLLTAGQDTPERPALTWYAGPHVYPYLMWSALALAVLTKGLVALVFFFATVVTYLVLTDTWREVRRLKPASGALLFLLIAAPWHILAGLRNTGGANGHGFFWFYFWNEHVLRFLGRRIPRDYNKLPGYLFWLQHLVWLFPWSLFIPLGLAAIWRRVQHQTSVITAHIPRDYSWAGAALVVGFGFSLSGLYILLHFDLAEFAVLAIFLNLIFQLVTRRIRAHIPPSPFHRIDPQQSSILLLSIFATVVLVFFSLSTNQEYYTLPAYLPILLLTAATITRAEQTFSTSPGSRRWITFAHITLVALGALITVALAYGLWSSRSLPYNPDIGSLLAHRAVGDYTLSTSHLFDLTTEAFAALRLPATLAALAFAAGPLAAWWLRAQRRHIAATTAIAFTAAVFLIAAHIAFARFGPLLSSKDFAVKIQQLETSHAIASNSQIMLFGDQAYGSSIPFYLGRQVALVDGRSTSMLFGSTFPDAPPIFLSSSDLLGTWGKGTRKLLFVPLEKRDEVDRLLGDRQILLLQSSGKALITDRPPG